jgi:hypothetical protein
MLQLMILRDDENIIPSISVTDIVSDSFEGMELQRHSRNENLKLFFNHSLTANSTSEEKKLQLDN